MNKTQSDSINSDNIDTFIIDILSKSLNISDSGLAEKVGLSISETVSRVKNIADTGLVDRYMFTTNHRVIDYKFQEGLFISCREDDLEELSQRFIDFKVVITAINLLDGINSDDTWFIIVVVGKTRNQIAHEINELFSGLEVFRAASFKRLVTFKLDDFRFTTEDLICTRKL